MKTTTLRILSLSLITMLAAAGCAPAEVGDEGSAEEVDESATGELSGVDPSVLEKEWRNQSTRTSEWKYLHIKSDNTFQGVINMQSTHRDDARVSGTYTAGSMVTPRADGVDYDVLIRMVITQTDVPISYRTKLYTVKYDNGWTSDGATFHQVASGETLRTIGRAQTMGSCSSCSMSDYDHRFRFTPTRVLIKEYVLPDGQGSASALPDPELFIKDVSLGRCSNTRDCRVSFETIELTTTELRDGCELQVNDYDTLGENGVGFVDDTIGETQMRLGASRLATGEVQRLFYPAFGNVERIEFTLDRL